MVTVPPVIFTSPVNTTFPPVKLTSVPLPTEKLLQLTQ